MGYLLIVCAVFLNVVKAYSSKKLSSKTECIGDNIDLSIIRNIFCIITGALCIAFGAGGDFMLPTRGIAICAVAGTVISVNYVAWVMALKTDAIVFASVANNANFIVVAVAGLLVFDEELTWSKGVAVLLIIVAMLFMVKYQSGVGKKPGLRDFILLFLVFLAGGVSSITEKLFTRTLPEVSTHVYTFYAFLFSIIILLVARLFFRSPTTQMTSTRKEKIVCYTPYAVVMGVSIYGVTYFKTTANAYLDTIVLYPLNNGLTFVASCLMAWACFKEKPNRNSIIGMTLVFLALLLSSGTLEKIFDKVF